MFDNVYPNRKTAPLLDLSNDTFDSPNGTNCAMWVGRSVGAHCISSKCLDVYEAIILGN